MRINSNKIIFILFACLFFACTKKSTTPVLGGSSSPDLSGTKWVIYQYKDVTTSTPQTRNDTLFFTNASNYKYNNQPYSYYLTYGDYTHLTLHGTPFGSLDGLVPNNFVQNGEIINVSFSVLTVSSQKYFLWMKKF